MTGAELKKWDVYLKDWHGSEATFEATTRSQARMKAARVLLDCGWVKTIGDALKRLIVKRSLFE
jgi:hypothetical protein